MPIDLIGKENVSKYIANSQRACFNINKVADGTGANVVPIWKIDKGTCASSNEAAQQFEEWASLQQKGGNGYVAYRITVHNGSSDGNERKGSMMYADFQLGEGALQPVQGAAPVAPVQVVQQAPAVSGPPQDVNALIAGAVETAIAKVQQQNELKAVYALLEDIRRRQDEKDLEEEEEEEEAALLAAEKLKIGAQKEMMQTGEKIFNGIKDFIMEVRTNGKTLTPPAEKLQAVAGEPETVKQVYKTPVSDTVGELPAYMEEPNHEDQRIKVNKAVAALYKQNGHLGDDLNLLVEMQTNTPKKFNNLMMQLRPDNE